jgi:hypothetical protein
MFEKAATPLVRWDGLHLVLDMNMVEHHVRQRLHEVEQLADVAIGGEGDLVRAEATVVWKGLRSRVAIDLGEIRLKHRFLGLRMRKLKVLGGLPVPRAAVEAILKAAKPQGVTVFPGDGIVVMDLREWLPPELELSILTVQATGRALHVWFGPGRLTDLPEQVVAALPASTES